MLCVTRAAPSTSPRLRPSTYENDVIRASDLLHRLWRKETTGHFVMVPLHAITTIKTGTVHVLSEEGSYEESQDTFSMNEDLGLGS